MNILTDKVIEEFLIRAPELGKFVNEVRNKMILKPQLKNNFEYLASAIVYQQITGKAAAAVEKKLLAKIGQYEPANILEHSEKELRSCGLSRQKAHYMHTLSEAFTQEEFLKPYFSPESLDSLTNQEIIKLISQVKGIGTWTVNMMLLFNLGRLDILAEGDLGVRKGIQIMYDLPATPKPKEIRNLTEHWGDLATVGTFLAWRVLHNERGDD